MHCMQWYLLFKIKKFFFSLDLYSSRISEQPIWIIATELSLSGSFEALNWLWLFGVFTSCHLLYSIFSSFTVAGMIWSYLLGQSYLHLIYSHWLTFLFCLIFTILVLIKACHTQASIPGKWIRHMYSGMFSGKACK